MKLFIELQQKLLPDLLETMQKRYQILQYIRLMQPIGRRVLASHLNMSERVLRSEVMFLKDQSLIEVLSSGMKMTRAGDEVLSKLEHVMKEGLGLSLLEQQLQQALNVSKVIVVPGDSDKNDLVKNEIGMACVNYLKGCLQADNVIAVTGGTTVAAAAQMMSPLPAGKKAIFVPARGGLGENVRNQANSICAKMAEQAQGEYRLLHVPDQVSMGAYQTIVSEPAVKEVLEVIESAGIVIHGIGDALTMAKRRKTSTEVLEKLRNEEALAEAFGYYFNEHGEVVYKVNTVGIQLDYVKKIPCGIALAGGTSKAKAIVAYMKQAHDTTLITDEGAAKALLSELGISN